MCRKATRCPNPSINPIAACRIATAHAVPSVKTFAMAVAIKPVHTAARLQHVVLSGTKIMVANAWESMATSWANACMPSTLILATTSAPIIKNWVVDLALKTVQATARRMHVVINSNGTKIMVTNASNPSNRTPAPKPGATSAAGARATAGATTAAGRTSTATGDRPAAGTSARKPRLRAGDGTRAVPKTIRSDANSSAWWRARSPRSSTLNLQMNCLTCCCWRRRTATCTSGAPSL
mmetsp:Transcript_57458/g.186650  ORF Transcript_57458/g.186650 Transcript_57458/m.186650 type:complete len:237 (+) Transcript_57458:551-1261(+)